MNSLAVKGVQVMSMRRYFSVAALLAVALAGCTGPQPPAYRGLDMAAQLSPSSGDGSRHIPFHYADNHADLSRYTEIMLDPVAVYSGPDHQFGDLSQEDRLALASYMSGEFAETLKAKTVGSVCRTTRQGWGGNHPFPDLSRPIAVRL